MLALRILLLFIVVGCHHCRRQHWWHHHCHHLQCYRRFVKWWQRSVGHLQETEEWGGDEITFFCLNDFPCHCVFLLVLICVMNYDPRWSSESGFCIIVSGQQQCTKYIQVCSRVHCTRAYEWALFALPYNILDSTFAYIPMIHLSTWKKLQKSQCWKVIPPCTFMGQIHGFEFDDWCEEKEEQHKKMTMTTATEMTKKRKNTS